MSRILLASVVALGVVALGACDDDPSPSPSPTPSTSSSGSPSGSSPSSPSSSAGGDPATPASTAPAAATGLAVEQGLTHVNAPEGWVANDQILPIAKTVSDPDSLSTIRLGEIRSFGDRTPAQLAASRIRLAPYPRKPKRLADVTLDGVEVYHIGGDIGGHRYLEEYGAVYRDKIVTLEFELADSIKPPERDELIASVVASFRWK